jgi:predicted dehydrogenase
MKVAIVGTGKAGIDLHLKSYQLIKDVQVIALVDSNLENARKLAADNHIPHACETLKDVFKKDKPDLVSICTPTFTHLQLSIEALQGGANVVLEKPILTNIDEAAELENVMKSSGKDVFAMHNKKFAPGFLQAMQMVKEGHIGVPLHVHSAWMQNGDVNRMTRDKDFWCHQLTGGRWEEMIPHQIYRSYAFLGDLKLADVFMRYNTHKWPWLPGDELEIVLESAKGYSSIKLSSNNEGFYDYFLVYGSKSVISIDAEKTLPFHTQDKTETTGESRGIIKRIGNRLKTPAKPEKVAAKPLSIGHYNLLSNAILYLKNPGTVANPVPWHEAKNTLEVTDQIAKAIAKKWQRTRE